MTDRAKRYERIKLLLNIGETVLVLLGMIIFIFGGYSIRWRNLTDVYCANPYLRLLIYLAGLGLAFSVISLPVGYIGGYWLEKKYRLSNQTFWSWVWEETKALLVGLVLFIPIILIFYYLLLHTPQTWWLWTALVLFVFSVLMGRLAAQVIFPLFYKFEKLENTEILSRMKTLAQKGGFRLEGIFRFNMSKTTKKANAAFTGLGKSRRIIIGDTLLESFSVDEIEAVFAHEVGHFVHRHLKQGIMTGTLITFFSLYVADYFYERLLSGMGFNGPADPAALPLLFLIISLIAFITTPLSNGLSRRNERQADRYALANGTRPEAFISAMEKLSEMNLSDKEPHPMVAFLFHSHPSISSRIKMARTFIENN